MLVTDLRLSNLGNGLSVPRRTLLRSCFSAAGAYLRVGDARAILQG